MQRAADNLDAMSAARVLSRRQRKRLKDLEDTDRHQVRVTGWDDILHGPIITLGPAQRTYVITSDGGLAHL